MAKRVLEVHFSVEMEEKDFEKLHKEAQEMGHGFGDAGPLETVRRYLMSDGTEAIEQKLIEYTIDDRLKK